MVSKVKQKMKAYEGVLFKFLSDNLMAEAQRGKMPIADCKKMVIAACINGLRFAQNIPNKNKSIMVYFNGEDKISKIMNEFQDTFYNKLLNDYATMGTILNFHNNDISMIIMTACINNVDHINRLDLIDEELEHYYND
jgi:hypothetical protein